MYLFNTSKLFVELHRGQLCTRRTFQYHPPALRTSMVMDRTVEHCMSVPGMPPTHTHTLPALPRFPTVEENRKGWALSDKIARILTMTDTPILVKLLQMYSG